MVEKHSDKTKELLHAS